MNILYFHQYFKTPSEPGGTRSYWIARDLIESGNDVTMITSSTRYKRTVEEVRIDGIKIIYIKVPYSQDMNKLRRFKSFFSFMIKSAIIGFRTQNIDLVIATSTPLTIGVPALILKWFKKIPFVFEVRDLWPEVPIQMGALKNCFLRKLALFLEKLVYLNAKHVIALSPGMQAGVAKYISESNITMIPNMSKIDKFCPRKKNVELMNSLNLDDSTFKIIHFGALGVANGAESIIETALLLKDNLSIEFIFIGGGSKEKYLKTLVQQYSLKNVRFLGDYDMDTTSEIVNICDVSIVSFMDLPILYTNSPNKLFDSLSAGKPIIVNSAGWTKDLVEYNNCGYYVNPNNPSSLVEKILFLQSHKDVVNEMGVNARSLAENSFDKRILCKKFSDVINRVI